MLVVVGLVLAFVSMLASTVMEGGNIGALIAIPSVVLVFGGTLGATIAAYSFGDIMKMPKVIIKSVTGKVTPIATQVTAILELADIARKDGHLALESKITEISDPVLKHGLTLLVDGADEGRIREELEGALGAMSERHKKNISIMSKAAGYAPIFGLMGTTMGLINMLGHLQEPEKIGHSLAVAMTATLYGLVAANAVFTPIADKLEKLHEGEVFLAELTTDGVCSMLHGLSGRAMNERLDAWLPPKARNAGAAAPSGDSDKKEKKSKKAAVAASEAE
jgi:chemotaxis protein MotA